MASKISLKIEKCDGNFLSMCVSCCLARLFVVLSIKFYLGFLKREPGDTLKLQAKAKEMLILGFIAQENYPLNMVEMGFFFLGLKMSIRCLQGDLQ